VPLRTTTKKTSEKAQKKSDLMPDLPDETQQAGYGDSTNNSCQKIFSKSSGFLSCRDIEGDLDCDREM
jgi:hypothetical protein